MLPTKPCYALALILLLGSACASTRPPLDVRRALEARDLAPSPRAPRVASPASAPRGEIGLASFYHAMFHGRQTANGEIFDNEGLTAAHRTLDFGTRVRVTNLANSRSVVVTITDRGPFVRGRKIDLSKRAARALGFVERGVARVRVAPIS